ncbi:MAG: hypothetical protein AAFP93_02580, partial [Bacteroidota bacterium]
ILHHQPWVFNFGVTNVRAQKEAYEDLKKWWQRLGLPIAKKMGISLATLDKRFFEKSMRGDWEEFATEAQKIKWVDHVIAGIEATCIKKRPTAGSYSWIQYIEEYYGMKDAVDTRTGKVYLPRLSAKDFYYLYDPESRYQVK